MLCSFVENNILIEKIINTLDLLLLVPILYGAWSGYRKGLVVEIVGVVAFLVAIIIGFKFLGFGMNFLAPHLGEQLSQRFMPYLAFSFIFFPTIFMLNRFGWMLRKALRYTILGTFDGMAGAIVGVFTWVFGISTFLWLLSSIGFHLPKDVIKDSVLYPYVVQVAPVVISKISDWIPAGGNLVREFL